MSAPAKTQALETLVEAHARELHLPAIRARFRTLAAEAVREQQTPLAYLAALLEAEVAERAERRERRRLLDARFPIIKRLEDFRFDQNTKVPQATIAALAEGSWIDDRESVIFIGESGTGKTMLATALAVCACQAGRRVRFTTLAGLATELQEADSRRELARVVGRYARTELVVLDELGYLALPEGAAELVFQVISERNERGSLIVTTNLPFGEWTKVFPRPPTRQSRRRPHHPQSTHHRHRHRILALPPRPRTPNPQTSMTPPARRQNPGDQPPARPSPNAADGPTARRSGRHTPPNARAAAIAAPPRPTGSAPRRQPRQATSRRDQATSTPTTTDAKWGHSKRPRRGHRKRPLRWPRRGSTDSAARSSTTRPRHGRSPARRSGRAATSHFRVCGKEGVEGAPW